MDDEMDKIVMDHRDIANMTSLNQIDLDNAGMNLFSEVGRGAIDPPRLVVVKYNGDKTKLNFDLALVGKGVTFDTGGLNLKPSGHIEDMYGDKGGACAVIGALKGVIDMKPK
jgi:leucyl aminopeptidase